MWSQPNAYFIALNYLPSPWSDVLLLGSHYRITTETTARQSMMTTELISLVLVPDSLLKLHGTICLNLTVAMWWGVSLFPLYFACFCRWGNSSKITEIAYLRPHAKRLWLYQGLISASPIWLPCFNVGVFYIENIFYSKFYVLFVSGKENILVHKIFWLINCCPCLSLDFWWG